MKRERNAILNIHALIRNIDPVARVSSHRFVTILTIMLLWSFIIDISCETISLPLNIYLHTYVVPQLNFIFDPLNISCTICILCIMYLLHGNNVIMLTFSRMDDREMWREKSLIPVIGIKIDCVCSWLHRNT